MDTKEPKWRRRKEERPGEILEAAKKLFAARAAVERQRPGFEGVTLDQIAHEAGVTKGTIYLYFKSKDELYDAAMEASDGA